MVDPPRALNMFYQPALQDLRARHPDLDIKLDYRPIPYLNLRTQFLKTMANQTPVDIITVDQLWLGEFVQKGFLTDITNRTYSWGRESEWYPANWASGIYNHKVYGISPYTDVRGMWYWKDLLNKSGVDPNSLKTWGWIYRSCKETQCSFKASFSYPSKLYAISQKRYSYLHALAKWFFIMFLEFSFSV